MNARTACMLTTTIFAVTVGGCGGASGSPAETITTFLHSAAVGDSATACAQMTDNAKRQMIKGVTCEDGMKLESVAFGSLVKNVKVSDVTTHGTTASAILRYNGRPITQYSLIKHGDKWLIDSGRRIRSASSSSTTAAPTKARVVAVIECLDKGVGAPLNAGGDSASGVPMVVLAVELRGKTVAMFDVFASAAGAATAYPAIKAHESPSVTKLVGSSVVVYMQHVSLDNQRAIEACD